jgi:hypothetical protein
MKNHFLSSGLEKVGARTLLLVMGVALMAGRGSADTIRIMPLGDSITLGITNGDGVYAWTGNGTFSFGYRGPLYTKLTDAGYDFQFVGASPEPWDSEQVPPTISGPDLRDVDQDHHRGYDGWKTAYITYQIVDWLNADDPDIVLLHIGTNNNDLDGKWEPTTSETTLKNLVQTIVDTKPNVKVIVAQIMPKYTLTSVLLYNNYIKNTLVPYFQNQGDFVTTVDQYANFLTADGVLDTSMFASPTTHGLIHPNVEGYDRMAQTWFDGIQVVVPEPGSIVMLLAGGVVVLIYAGRRRRS